MKKERRGIYFKLFSLTINGVTYFFIGSIKYGGFQWVYRNSEEAVDMFEKLERRAEKHGEAK